MATAIPVVLAGVAFAGLADAVVDGEAHPLDERVLLAFREGGDPTDPVRSAEVEEAVRDLNTLGGVLTTLATAVGDGFYLLDRRPRAAAFLACAVAGGVAVTYALKAGFDRPRPDLVAHAARSASFPSAHAATAAVVYLTLEALPRRRLKVYAVSTAVAITIGVGVSRVYLGVHWPTDVLAGWTLGAAWALAAWLVERDLRRRGWVESRRTLTAPPEEDGHRDDRPADAGWDTSRRRRA